MEKKQNNFFISIEIKSGPALKMDKSYFFAPGNDSVENQKKFLEDFEKMTKKLFSDYENK